MSLIGGTAIPNDFHWTSTQNNSTNSWILDYSDGNFGYYSKYYKFHTRAFCPIS